MTMMPNVPSDVEAGLLARAQAHGVPLEDYLVDHGLRAAVQTPPARRKSIVALFAPYSWPRSRFQPQSFNRASG